MVVPENSAADTPDHRAVALDDRPEDGFFLACEKAIQELSVRETPDHAHVEEVS